MIKCELTKYIKYDMNNNMEICIDQRIELITIIQTLSGYWDNLAQKFNNKILFQCNYKDNIKQYFEKYKQSEAIKLHVNLCNNINCISTFLALILNYSIPPNLSKIVNNNCNKYEHFINSIRKFYLETNFYEFFENNQNIYDKILSDSGIKYDLLIEINSIFEYFNIDNRNYKVIISPLVFGNFGINNDTGNYIILSPFDYRDNKYIFGPKDNIKGIIWHEIGHTVINDLTNKYYDESKHKNIEVPEIFVNQFYNNIKAIINAYIIRSIVYLLEKDINSKKEILDYEIKSGFNEIENISKYILENCMENNKFKKENKYEELIELVINKVKISYCA
jgi:hypothetical protein